MFFDSNEEMFVFYNPYSKQEGFPMKVRTSKKREWWVVKYVTFACGRSGKLENKSINVLKSKPIAKNGCDAKIRGCLN